MAAATDEDKVAAVLGDCDVTGANGVGDKISTQFVRQLGIYHISLDILVSYDQKSFGGTIDTILENINNYTMPKPVLRGLLMKLKPAQQGGGGSDGQDLDYVALGKEIGKEVGKGIVKALNEQNKYACFERVSQSTAAREAFKLKLIDYYETDVCMVTGEKDPVGSHLIPASATKQDIKDLSEKYRHPFRKGSARNGLLLCQDLETGLTEGSIVIVCDTNGDLLVKALDDGYKTYDGKKLNYTNKKAMPYRRVLKFHYEWAIGNLTDKEKISLNIDGNNATPWLTYYELSEIDSTMSENEAKNDSNDTNQVESETQSSVLSGAPAAPQAKKNDGKNNTNQKNNSDKKPKVYETVILWQCPNCPLKNPESLRHCSACYTPRRYGKRVPK